MKRIPIHSVYELVLLMQGMDLQEETNGRYGLRFHTSVRELRRSRIRVFRLSMSYDMSFLWYVIVKKMVLYSGWIATTIFLNMSRNFCPRTTWVLMVCFGDPVVIALKYPHRQHVNSSCAVVHVMHAPWDLSTKTTLQECVFLHIMPLRNTLCGCRVHHTFLSQSYFTFLSKSRAHALREQQPREL
jgi:hypothetical protein